MPDVNMPKLSDTMEEGTIVEWKKSSGDDVHKGDVLAEVESDKATFDLEAEDDGKLEILVEKGVPAKIGAPIARIGEGAPAKAEKAEAPAPAEQAEAESATPVPASQSDADLPTSEEVKEEAPPPSASKRQPAPDSDGQGARDVRASPLAKRIAEEMGVDLSQVKGTGPEGRIVKEDVIAAAGSTKKERRRPDAQPAPTGPDVEVIAPNRMQATIARRMA